MPLYRQGDVLIETVKRLPEGCERLKKLVLAHGEVTGHRHQIKERKAARLYLAPPRPGAARAELFLEVLADQTAVRHPEHAAILLDRGVYRVWQQREFVGAAVRRMAD